MTKTIATCALILSFSQTISAQTSNASEHIIVYKTKKNYRDNVPVILSEDRSTIISYPHPSDLKIGGQLALPVKLRNGYLMDKRGIGKNVAFLKLTYKEYAALEQAPSLEDMYAQIVDKDPLIMLCDCGIKSSFKNSGQYLNRAIRRQELTKKCKTIK